MARIVNTEAWATVNSTNGIILPVKVKKKNKNTSGIVNEGTKSSLSDLQNETQLWIAHPLTHL